MAREAKEHEFGTPEWLADRDEELDESMAGFDPAKEMIIPMSWDGVYKFRALPVFEQVDYLVAQGFHWGVFPSGDVQKKVSKDGCPLFTHNLHCPICHAIDSAVAEKKAEFKDFIGEGGIAVQKRYLLRVVLLDAQLQPKKGQAPPKFRELPVLKILELPTSVAKVIRGSVADKDLGWGAVFDPEAGLTIKVIRDRSKPPKDMYETKLLPQPSPVPAEFIERDSKGKLVQPANWPDIHRYLPAPNTDALMAKIEKYQDEVPAIIANYALAIDVGPGERRALPPASERDDDASDEQGTSSEAIQAMKARMRSGGKAKRG